MCDEDDKVSCSTCGEQFDSEQIGHDGLCASCHELDYKPTSKRCDQCGGRAVTNICGTNLCEDCLEHYHF